LRETGIAVSFFASKEIVSDDRDSISARPHLSRRSKIVIVILAFAAGLAIAGFIAADYAIHHAEPMLRARVIQTLSTRFDSQVELGELDVTLTNGVGVEGKNLSLRSNLYPDLPPQIRVAQFSFHTRLLNLFQSPMRVGLVEVHGLVMKIPPKGERSAMPRQKKGHGKVKIVIDRIVCNDALVILMTDNPASVPLRFQIHELTLRRVGSGRPMLFEARLVNPKPVGDIATQGHFGPWNAIAPHSTHVDGTYSFTNADLSTTKGITGILSSTGKFFGALDTITVDGATDTPNFSVDVSGHKVALHTDFHAIVDGTNGDTNLQPVRAHFLDTDVTATGLVKRAEGGKKGHHITLNVRVDKGRIEDLLELGAKTDPPVMRGGVRLRTSFDLPAGKESVSRRLRLNGTFTVDNASFANPRIQQKVDELSLRGQGKAVEAKQLPEETDTIQPPLPKIPVTLQATFAMANRKITLPQLDFKVPGAEIMLAGVYTLDGKQFDFTGHARMQAHVSSIVGGWKGKLLTPLDPFLAKHGAGTEVPIKITGTQSNPQFALNFKH
jgi:hypothetical protein